MSQQPLVSFIMPVYNAADYLTESIASVLNQSYPNIELIAVNDGSQDTSLAMLEAFAAKDDRLVIVNQKNTGIVGALNNTPVANTWPALTPTMSVSCHALKSNCHTS